MTTNEYIVGPYAKYERIDKLGQGTYSVVYKARNIATKEVVAIKKLTLQMRDGIEATTIREVSLLRQFKHENIIKLLDFFPRAGKMYLVLELMQSDLKQRMRSVELPVTLIKSYIHQIMKALAFCHANRIMHRDVKPENILIGSSGEVKIADFGTARLLLPPRSSNARPRSYTADVCTLWYRAPEIFLSSGFYSMEVDVWSAGTIFAEMLCQGRPIFPGDSDTDAMMRIFRVLGKPTEEKWPGVTTMRYWRPDFPNWPGSPLNKYFRQIEEHAIDLLSKMLVYDPKKRVTARDALSHPYFEND
jgi:serine/threonine protein kinase